MNTEDSESDTFDNPWSHFEGLGLGPEVPVYLRTTGKVQNLRYSKKETELFLNEIWIAKEQYEAHLQREKAKVSKSEYLEEPSVANGGKIHLKDFYLVFLDVSSPAVPPMTCLPPSLPQEKFKTQTRALEFSYNYFDSLKKYDFDSDCKLFLMIMHGELAEEVSRSFPPPCPSPVLPSSPPLPQIRHDQLMLLNTLLVCCLRLLSASLSESL